jgi:hypothetical protein
MPDRIPTRYQISFVADGHRFQADFMATEAEANRAMAVLDEPMRGAVSDFQVYRVTHDSAGTAGDLVSTLVGALRFRDDVEARFRAASDVADAIDAAASVASGFAVRTLDFVWDNGGGDDNCFTASYLLSNGCELGDEFEALVSKALDDDTYDLAFTDDTDMVPDRDLSGIADALANAAGRMEQEGFDEIRDLMIALAKEPAEAPTAPRR